MSLKILSARGSKRSRRRRNPDDEELIQSPAKSEEPHFRGLPHRGIISVVLTLSLFGLMVVFSASASEALHSYHDATAYLRKQTIACIIGLFLMFTISRYDYVNLKKFAWPLGWFSLILLALTMVPGLSTTSFGSSRWLQIGPFQFQPSEMAKMATILLLATGLSKHFWWQRQCLFRIALIMSMAAIVVKQPDLGSTLMILSGLIVLLFVTGMNAVLMGGSLVGGVALVWTKIVNTPYQMARIDSWLNPYLHPQKEGWNIIQAQLAIGSGGWFGVGLGRSLQKLHYLPVQHADFIFAVIAEELGFIGCMTVVSLFAIFGFFGFQIAFSARTLFGRLLAIGITSSICIQAAVNIMVTTGLLPVTGITLPFISYGGSSFVITLAMVGVLLSISRDKTEADPDGEEEEGDEGKEMPAQIFAHPKGSLIPK